MRLIETGNFDDHGIVQDVSDVQFLPEAAAGKEAFCQLKIVMQLLVKCNDFLNLKRFSRQHKYPNSPLCYI